MKRTTLLTSAIVVGACVFSASAQVPWATEFFPRRYKFDIYGIGEYLHQGDTTFPGPPGNDITMTLHDTGLGGIGMAFHPSDFISLHSDFLLGPATFTARQGLGPSYSLGDNGYIQSSKFNVDYNIINRRITPFITAGIGYQYFSVDQSYYSGYYHYHSYYSETDFTWNVGAGVRWNITDHLFVKVTGGAQWLEYQDAHDITTQIEASFAIGLTMP